MANKNTTYLSSGHVTNASKTNGGTLLSRGGKRVAEGAKKPATASIAGHGEELIPLQPQHLALYALNDRKHQLYDLLNCKTVLLANRLCADGELLMMAPGQLEDGMASDGANELNSGVDKTALAERICSEALTLHGWLSADVGPFTQNDILATAVSRLLPPPATTDPFYAAIGVFRALAEITRCMSQVINTCRQQTRTLHREFVEKYVFEAGGWGMFGKRVCFCRKCYWLNVEGGQTNVYMNVADDFYNWTQTLDLSEWKKGVV
jgi:hypothetical protein